MASADAAVGMMDAAYFTGRKELLEFFNSLLDLNLTKIEQTASGAIACQLTEIIFPGSVPMSKVNWEAKSDYEFIQNYKLLQNAFTKNRIQRYVDVDKLIRAKYQDNLEFCQWLKAFYDQSGVFREDYDPALVRAKGKGGKKFNELMAKGVKKQKSTNPPQRPRPTGTSTSSSLSSSATTATTKTLPAVRTANNNYTTKSDISSPSPNSPSSTVSNKENGINHSAEPIEIIDPALVKENEDLKLTNHELKDLNDELTLMNETLAQENDELKKDKADTLAKFEELEQAVLDIEKERDFYFEKLRNVEVMLQVYQEKPDDDKDSAALVDNVFKVLYASAEDGITVNEEGHVVEVPPLHEQATGLPDDSAAALDDHNDVQALDAM